MTTLPPLDSSRQIAFPASSLPIMMYGATRSFSFCSHCPGEKISHKRGSRLTSSNERKGEQLAGSPASFKKRFVSSDNLYVENCDAVHSFSSSGSSDFA